MIAFKVFKLFFKNDMGSFRYYFLFPVLSAIVGGYIVFMTLSIMTGMENNLIHRFNAFNYLHSISNINDESKKYFESNKFFKNKGFERVSIVSYGSSVSTAIVKCYSDLEPFLANKLNSFIINSDDSINKNNVIIGDELAKKLNVDVGDSLLIKSPIDINMSSKYVPNKKVIISHIFDINIYDYDRNYIIGSIKTFKNIYVNANINYYLSDDVDKTTLNSIDLNYDSQYNDLLVESINFEKKIYTSLGFFVFIVTFFMLFNMMSLSIVQKHKQISIMNIIGLSRKKIFTILFNMGFLINIVFCIIGYILAEITIFLNIKYGFFNFLFNSLPFVLKMGQLTFTTTILIIISLSLLIGLSVSLPGFYNMKKDI